MDTSDSTVSASINHSSCSFIHRASAQALDRKRCESAGKEVPLPLFKRAGSRLRKSTGKILTQAVTQMRDFERDFPTHAISNKIEKGFNSIYLSISFYS